MHENNQVQFKDVLVIDDDISTRRILKLALERAGYEVRTCADASEACWEIASRAPSYIISDWQMPTMDGAALCEWVRNRDASPYIYFILMTAHEKFFDVIDGLDAGADDYVKKPLNIPELLSRLRCGARILTLESRLRSRNCCSAESNGESAPSCQAN